jgi:hypothetical protein
MRLHPGRWSPAFRGGDNPCPTDSCSNGILLDVEYRADLGRWRLFSGVGTSSADAQFNIVVLPEQVEQCAVGRLFRDSFESNRYEDARRPEFVGRRTVWRRASPVAVAGPTSPCPRIGPFRDGTALPCMSRHSR